MNRPRPALAHSPLRALLALTITLSIALAALAPGAMPALAAGTVALTQAGVAYTESFDSLASSATSNTTPNGWAFVESGTNANTTYTAGTGSSTTGDTYSFGTSGSGERAFGGLLSGSLVPTIGAAFANNTGATISALDIGYVGEQWRLGTASREDRLDFQYSTNATSLTTGTWVDVNALDFVAPTTSGAVGALDGNASANRAAVSGTVGGLSVAPGTTFWVRWSDFNATNSDDGLAVDDFSLIPSTGEEPPTPMPPSGGGVVISQIFGSGGNTGAPYTNDFIELYNRSGAAVSLAGWSVQYAGSSGATWQVTNLSGTIAPGAYYLIQQSAGTSCTDGTPCGAPLPTPNATGSINMGSTAGKVALVASTTALSGACPVGGAIVDFVGYGSNATCFEGSGPTATLTNTTAALRTNNGATDTNNNAADFTAGAPAPRNSGGAAPSIATQPQSQTIAANQSVTLSVTAAGTAPLSYQWYRGAAGDTSTPVGTNAPSYTTPALTETTSYWVRVSNAAGFANSDTATIAVESGPPACLAPTRLISEVQGSGATTPINGQVVTVQGVVTGIFPGLSTINVQEEPADQDANPNSSEGIAVFLGGGFAAAAAGLSAGDLVSVRGTVGERNTNSGASFQTQISGNTANPVVVTSCGPSAPIAPVDVTFPLASAADLERYESMLVRFPQELFIAEYFNYDRFGEIVLGYADDLARLGDTGRFYNPTSIVAPGPAATALTDAYALRRITLDDGISAAAPSSLTHPSGQPFSQANSFRGGDRVAGTTGVIEETFGVYRIQPTAYGTFTQRNPRPAAPADVGGRLTVASYNVLNYFLSIDTTSSNNTGPCGPLGNQDCRGADSQIELERQRSKLLEALKAIDADVFGLIELENTPGKEPLADIVDGLNAALGAGTFAYVDTGVVGTDAIRVGLIYKTASVTPAGPYAVLDSQAFVNPRNATVDRNRPALAQTFEERATAARFTVVVNHLKSKGSGCGANDDDPIQGNCNLTRTLSAEALVDWLATDPTGSGDPDFLIIGDLNSYAFEDPIVAIERGSDGQADTADDFINLVRDRLGPFAYSYVFDGQAGYLDHALANRPLAAQVTGVTDWHINADEPDIFDYNDAVQTAGEPDNERRGVDVTDSTSPFRTSDHDPVLVGLALNAPPTINAGGPYTVAEGGSTTLAADATDATYGESLQFAWDFDGDGQFDDATSDRPTFSAANLDGPTGVTVGVRVTDRLGLSATATTTVSVTNVAPTVSASFAAPSVACSAASTISGTVADPGLADTFTALIDWGDGSAPRPVAVANGAFSATYTYARAGRYTATVAVTDDDGGTGEAGAATAVNYTVVGGGLLPPLSQDGTSVFRYGRTVPVKVQLADCDGRFPANLAPTIGLTLISGNAPGPVNTPPSSSAADTTGVLRFDAANNQYIYNLGTSSLPDPTGTYRITITVPATGQTIEEEFGVR